MKININIKLDYSPETEAKQVYHCAWWAMKNFYFPHGWYVFENDSKASDRDPVVFLPRIDYSKIVFNNLKLTNFNFNSFNAKTLAEIKKLIPLIKPTFKSLTLKKLAIDQILVNITPSYFGSYGSFDQAFMQDKTLVIGIQPRLDQPKEVVAELIISSLIYLVTTQEKQFDWRDREAVSDFIMRHVLGYKDFITTLERTAKPRPDLLKKSLEFLRSVGLPTYLPIEYDEKLNRILVMGKDASLEFGPYEFRVLRSLLLNLNQTLTYDQLSDLMHQVYPETRFSLWSVTKVVQRLRDKLEKFGFPRNTIQTVYGEGFKLVSGKMVS